MQKKNNDKGEENGVRDVEGEKNGRGIVNEVFELMFSLFRQSD